jgi:hypothetical protein
LKINILEKYVSRLPRGSRQAKARAKASYPVLASNFAAAQNFSCNAA